MSVMIRILVIIILVVLGFTAAFPQWLDFVTEYNYNLTLDAQSQRVVVVPAREVVVEPIKLFGSIGENTHYVAKVTYYTTSDAVACTESSFSGQSPLVKTFEFEPFVDNGQHRIEIPLDSVDGNSTCQWKPRYLETCLERGNDEPKQHCITLFDAKPNTAIHSRTGKIDLGQEMDGNTINIECEPFDVYESQTKACYLPRPYDNDFKFPTIMIANRYSLTPGQNVEVNFNILSVVEVQERDIILESIRVMQVEKNKEERRMYEQNKRNEERIIEQERAAYEAKVNRANGR